MPKWILYGLAAVVDFGLAVLFYSTGRIVVPAVLFLAGLFFVVATVKAARPKPPPERRTRWRPPTSR